MRSLWCVLTVCAALIAPAMSGCGPSPAGDEEVDVEASDTGSVEAPVNDADNP